MKRRGNSRKIMVTWISNDAIMVWLRDKGDTHGIDKKEKETADNKS